MAALKYWVWLAALPYKLLCVPKVCFKSAATKNQKGSTWNLFLCPCQAIYCHV